MKHKPPKRLEKQSFFTWIVSAAVILFFINSMQQANVSFEGFIKGFPNMLKFLSEGFPPDISKLDVIGVSLIETFQMAFAGTVIGTIIALPLAVLASPSQTPISILKWPARAFIALFRTVPDLVWALIFVISVGLGPFAGTLAIVVDTVGFCGRFFSEAMEEVDKRPQEALIAIGASKFSKTVCAVIPNAFPSFVNTSLFALEKATRSSVILGLVGAGGIGLQLKVSMDLFQYDRASLIILLMFILVLSVEKTSMIIRKKVM